MQKAGGIVTLIAGIFAVFAAGFTLLFGGVSAAFDADEAETIVYLGWGGIVFSFLTIVFGAISMNSKSRAPGILTILSAIAGAFLGGGLVAIFMILALIGGIMSTIATPKRELGSGGKD